MRRREFLETAGATTVWSVGSYALTAIAKSVSSIAAPAPPPLRIDVHCHLFNGQDLPVYGLLLSVFLEQNIWGPFAEPFALWLAITIEQNSPDWRDEMDETGNLAANPALASRDKPGLDQIARFLEGGLNTFIDERTSFGRPQAGILTDRNDAFLLELMRRFSPPGTLQNSPTKSDISKLLSNQQFRRELIRQILEYRTKGAATGVDEIAEYISQFCKWVGTAVSYHSRLADELTGTFGESAPDELRIMSPAIVDFGPWPTPDWLLYQDKLRTVDEQAALLEKIALIRRRGRAVHGFIGFDPWRYLKNRGTTQDSYVVMTRAIEQRGFIGVKLYPPMGFLPLDNIKLPDNSFPDELVELCRPRPVGRALDEVLRKVYQYCDRNGVAVMAHCSDSIGSHPGYATRSAPQNWIPVLKEFPNLRINLGHFGGIWDFFYKPSCRQSSNTDWPRQIGSMVQQHENLYFDVADFSAVLDRWDSETCATEEIFKNIKVLLQRYPQIKSHIMYGSDWMLLDREPRNEGYYAAMRQKFAGVLGTTALDNFLSQNAARFLGLHKGQPTRARIERFYEHNRQPAPDFDKYLA